MHKIPTIILMSLLAVGCSTAPKSESEVVRLVKTATAKIESNSDKYFAGLSTPDDAVNLAFKISGQILSIPVAKGQMVEKGELIASLDPKQVELEVEANRTAYTEAQSQLRRMERLLSHEAISEQEWESTKTRFAQAKSSYENSLSQLSDTKLRAPFDGVIESTAVDAYQRVDAGQTIARLVNPLTTTVSFTMPESSLYLLEKPTTKYSVTFDNYPGIRFDASLKNFARTSINASGFPTSLRLNSDKLSLYPIAPGMSCTIKIEYQLSKEPKITIPLSAVYAPTSSGEWVWVVGSDNRVRLQSIKIGGILPNGNVTIESGLKAGEKVVSAGVYRLSEGQKVKII